MKQDKKPLPDLKMDAAEFERVMRRAFPARVKAAPKRRKTATPKKKAR